MADTNWSAARLFSEVCIPDPAGLRFAALCEAQASGPRGGSRLASNRCCIYICIYRHGGCRAQGQPVRPQGRGVPPQCTSASWLIASHRTGFCFRDARDYISSVRYSWRCLSAATASCSRAEVVKKQRLCARKHALECMRYRGSM